MKKVLIAAVILMLSTGTAFGQTLITKKNVTKIKHGDEITHVPDQGKLIVEVYEGKSDFLLITSVGAANIGDEETETIICDEQMMNVSRLNGRTIYTGYDETRYILSDEKLTIKYGPLASIINKVDESIIYFE